LPQRARFAAEILKAVRAAVGPDFPVILRVSQWKSHDFAVKLAKTPAELEAWLAPWPRPAPTYSTARSALLGTEFEGSDLNFAGWAKKLTGRPTITVGSVGLSGDMVSSFKGQPSQVQSLDALIERLARGEFDLVAVGRALLNDPLWLQKIKEGRADELRSFDAKSLGTLY